MEYLSWILAIWIGFGVGLYITIFITFLVSRYLEYRSRDRAPTTWNLLIDFDSYTSGKPVLFLLATILLWPIVLPFLVLVPFVLLFLDLTNSALNKPLPIFKKGQKRKRELTVLEEEMLFAQEQEDQENLHHQEQRLQDKM